MNAPPVDEKPADAREGRHIRDTTRSLVKAVMLDVWPSVATVVDFGLNTQEHYEALYYPLRHGDITPEQVDAALGNGRLLSELVNAAPHNPHKGIEFRTGWDGLALEPDCDGCDDEPQRLPTLSEIARGKQAVATVAEKGKEAGKDNGIDL